jgi:hypothetical protein
LLARRRTDLAHGHSGLSLFNCGEHAFTEIQAFSVHAAAEGISELTHLNGKLM